MTVWARGTYGGSTGGWEAFAAQVLYPKEYNGCIACAADPIDFRALLRTYQSVQEKHQKARLGQHRKIEGVPSG